MLVKRRKEEKSHHLQVPRGPQALQGQPPDQAETKRTEDVLKRTDIDQEKTEALQILQDLALQAMTQEAARRKMEIGKEKRGREERKRKGEKRGQEETRKAQVQARVQARVEVRVKVKRRRKLRRR